MAVDANKQSAPVDIGGYRATFVDVTIENLLLLEWQIINSKRSRLEAAAFEAAS